MSRREFPFREGSSNKFWAITVDGAEFTVEFGRIGTTGQSQTKKFTSDAAQQAADKLIAEKTKKGYKEVGGSTSPASTAAPAPIKAKAKKQTTEPAALPPARVATPVSLTVERVIALEPRDWLWATWRSRDRYVTPPSQPQPFDKGVCLEQFRSRVKVRVEDGGWWDWGKIKLPQPLSAARPQGRARPYAGTGTRARRAKANPSFKRRRECGILQAL